MTALPIVDGRELSDDHWLTVAEVAKWLHMSPETVHRLITSGALIGLRVPGGSGRGQHAIVRVQMKALREFLVEYSTG